MATVGPNFSKLPLLTADDAIPRQRKATRSLPNAPQMKAFYSSVFGGICLQPESDPDAVKQAFNVPLDDHGFHRGHACFDTCNVAGGHAYALDIHLERLANSASKARIPLPQPRPALKELIIDLIAASGVKDDGGVRMWLTAGRGNFDVSPKDCDGGPQFYAIVLQNAPLPMRGLRAPCREWTSTQPLKSSSLATMKSTNYLLNALVAMEAEDRGGSHGIQVDDGKIAEGAVCNVGFVLRLPDGTKELVSPPFDCILSGCSVQRAFALARSALDGKEGPELQRRLKESGLARVAFRHIALEEAKAGAVELIKFGGSYLQPVVEWDGSAVGGGEVGPVARALGELIAMDTQGLTSDAGTQLDKVPYEKYDAVRSSVAAGQAAAGGC